MVSLLVMMFFGVGRADGGDISIFEPPDETSCAIVCELLQLSGMYMLEHLKQWCESYLGAPQVVDLYNICDLLVIADRCQAIQLAKVCTHHIRAMISIVMKMEQWSLLSESLKANVLSHK